MWTRSLLPLALALAAFPFLLLPFLAGCFQRQPLGIRGGVFREKAFWGRFSLRSFGPSHHMRLSQGIFDLWQLIPPTTFLPNSHWRLMLTIW